MEWPTIEVQTPRGKFSPNHNISCTTANATDPYLADLTASLITKEIYARAANAAVADITIDHGSSGLQARVDAFLEKLRSTSADDNWDTEYRNVAREFTELMASTQPRSRALEICQGGLDAVHDLLKYRVPAENQARGGSKTILAARDAYVLCQSFPKLNTMTFTGTRAPDLDFRFGLLTKAPLHNHRDVDDADSTLFGVDACNHVSQMRKNGQLENSAASLANHTLMNSDLVARLAHKTFVVLGCDHQLSPTKSLLRIPGVTVLGIASSRRGLESVIGYATFNTPDDTTFVYPTLTSSCHEGIGKDMGVADDDWNLILSRGPHVAHWILENTNKIATANNQDDEDAATCHTDSELVLVPMPIPFTTVDSAESSVRWAAACDLILQRVLRARSKTTRCSVWSYQSSTTCMVVPPTSMTMSTELLRNRPLHEPWLHTLSMGTMLTPTIDEEQRNNRNPYFNTNPNRSPTDRPTEHTHTAIPAKPKEEGPSTNHDYSVVNGIMTLQGPYHILSEHIRMWRAMVTNFRYEQLRMFRGGGDGGHLESDDDFDDDEPCNDIHVFAPHVPLLSPHLLSDQDGHLLKPLRVFDTGTASSLLAAISIAGLVDPIINRPMPLIEMGEPRGNDNRYCAETTPFAMFWNGSVHGGIWNCPYTLDSASGTAGYFLGQAYKYYHSYRNSTTTSASSGADGGPSSSSSSLKGKQGLGTAAVTLGRTINTKDDSNKSIVDVVPSSTQRHQDLQDGVKERLEFLA